MKSLRLRLVVTLCVAICVLWSSLAVWMFGSMRRELLNVLDERLIASTRMVAGIVGQFSLEQIEAASKPGKQADLTSVIARDGVACEVSLVRSEVELLPIARTDNSPGFDDIATEGFGSLTKGGKQWRTYVLEDNGIRITTADRMDVRAHLVESFGYAMVLPFALALLGLLVLSWWACSLGLEPLRRLQVALERRPPQDSTPIQHGQDFAEIAPLVGSLNDLLARMNAAIEHERRWTADAAHELRTPLTVIKTHVQIAQLVLKREASVSALPSDSARTLIEDALQRTMAGIGHMHETLEQLLLLARVESGEQEAGQCLSGSDIVATFQRACDQSLRHAQEKGWQARLQVQVSPAAAQEWAACHLALPASLLVCVVGNLVDNALRHHQGQDGVLAVLELVPNAPHATMLRIAVHDRGPGMSQQECQQALQRFWRKSAQNPGSGLGLTIVQRIVQYAGGTLALQPRDGGGLCACVELPLGPVASPAPASARQGQSHAGSAHTTA